MITIAFGWHRLLGTYDTYQLSSSVAELGPLSLIAAYVSVYWFSVDRDFPSAESSVAAAGTTRHATTSPLLPHPKPVSLGIAAI
jgi:hypothetical protein